MTPRPFISYAREDRDVAIRLRNDLARWGAAPWIDIVDLIAGQDWPLAISRALRDSSHFLVLVSRHSVTKRGYVQKEVREAIALLDLLPPDAIFVVPVRLDDSEPVHGRLRNLHWVDLFVDYDKGLRQIARSLGLSTGDETHPSQQTSADANQHGDRDLIVKLHVGELRGSDIHPTPRFLFQVANPNRRPATICGAGVEARTAGISAPAFMPQTLFDPPRLALPWQINDGQRADFMESVEFFDSQLEPRHALPPIEIIGYVIDAFGNRHESEPTIYARSRGAG